MPVPHQCPKCQHVKFLEEINDDESIDPKLKLNELVQLQGRGSAMFRVLKMDHLVLTLEKL